MIDYKLLANTAMLAGEIMLCSGAETYRVEDTMYHILKTSNIESTQVIAMMTGLVVTLNDPGFEQPVTMMRRVSERSTNVSNIVKVNDISRRYCEEKISLEEAYEELRRAKGKQYNRLLYNFSDIFYSRVNIHCFIIIIFKMRRNRTYNSVNRFFSQHGNFSTEKIVFIYSAYS